MQRGRESQNCGNITLLFFRNELIKTTVANLSYALHRCTYFFEIVADSAIIKTWILCVSRAPNFSIHCSNLNNKIRTYIFRNILQQFFRSNRHAKFNEQANNQNIVNGRSIVSYLLTTS